MKTGILTLAMAGLFTVSAIAETESVPPTNAPVEAQNPSIVPPTDTTPASPTADAKPQVSEKKAKREIARKKKHHRRAKRKHRRHRG